jgi:cytochrome c peroxidase
MKKLFILLFFAAAVAAATGLAFKEPQKPLAVVALVHRGLGSDIDSLLRWYDSAWMRVVNEGEEKAIQSSFREGRRLYKKMEWAVEFFFPKTAKDINGAPLPEIEVEEHIVLPPSGFQVIEELVYPYNNASKKELLSESQRLKSILHRLKDLWRDAAFRDDQVWAALRLEVLRISSLGLSGFDTPLSGASVEEMRYSLQGIRNTLSFYAPDPKSFDTLNLLLRRADALLANQRDPLTFDRLDFLRGFLDPLSHQLLGLQKRMSIPVQTIHAVNLEGAGYFDSAAFRNDFFIPGSFASLSIEKIKLGEDLFSTTLLSISNKTSCASCHHPAKAFTDGLVKGRSHEKRELPRNTPTLLYAGLQQKQFYDMKAGYLEDQIRNVIENKDEIHGSLPLAVSRLNADFIWREKFRLAFDMDSASELLVQTALASYIRSLNPFSSRFDEYMRGKQELSATEKQGFNLFMGKAKCGSCHFMPVFNGTIPPVFASTESEVIGVPARKSSPALDTDPGRYSIYKIPELQFAFKTPTLRNIGRTAPYMHNGVFNTLEEVIDFYNEGGALGRGISLENQTLPPDRLNLTPEEKKSLVAFLRTLDDR